ARAADRDREDADQADRDPPGEVAAERRADRGGERGRAWGRGREFRPGEGLRARPRAAARRHPERRAEAEPDPATRGRRRLVGPAGAAEEERPIVDRLVAGDPALAQAEAGEGSIKVLPSGS